MPTAKYCKGGRICCYLQAILLDTHVSQYSSKYEKYNLWSLLVKGNIFTVYIVLVMVPLDQINMADYKESDDVVQKVIYIIAKM